MKKIMIYVALLAVTFTSCSDFLTEEPKQSQSNELTLSKHLNEATAGCYARLQSYTWYGAYHILAADLTGGNMKHSMTLAGSNRYTNANEVSWNFTATNTSSIWSYCYYTINSCNEVLGNIGNDATGASQATLNNWTAEALFLRALCHFDLVTTYAQPYTYAPDSLGVPIMLKSDLAAKPKRNTVREVYNQIVADLTAADSLMADGYYRTTGTDKFAFASKPAIEALLSRVYLYMGNWQKCADYATKVISSGKFQLADKATYRTMWTNNVAADGGEVIFELYSSNKNAYWDGSGWEGISYVCDPAGSGDVCATNDIYSMYEDGDVRKELFVANENEHFTTKYAGKAGSATPKENNVIILRLSELYLNRAEALMNGAVISGTSAAKDLKAITDARGASVQSPSGTTIFNERRKELAFEGHLYYDYKRLKKSITRTDFDGSLNKDVTFPGYLWAYPISKNELDANPNMVQNAGY